MATALEELRFDRRHRTARGLTHSERLRISGITTLSGLQIAGFGFPGAAAGAGDHTAMPS